MKPLNRSRGRTNSAARGDARIITVSSDCGRSPLALGTMSSLASQVLAAERVPRAMLSITLLSRARMATLNRRHLGHQGPTDIITFALGRDPSDVLVSDVYICPDKAREHARALDVGIREELARLVIHGVLHSCGHVHPEGEGREKSSMWRRQERLLARLWPPLASS